jgi:sugar phosphate isomerase/epimerase
MVDVGEGVIDWRDIYAARTQAGIKHWFVEHDEPKDPMQSLAASYGYMRGL